MSRNVFLPQNQGEMKLKRNSFDLSKSSVFTSDFFKLYPHFCQEVIPGDTFEIDAQVGMRALPTVFPVQTRVRISQEFYYVRNRTLQDHFEDMIFKTKDVEHPWLRMDVARAKSMISVGSLGDAFNVPSTMGAETPFTQIFPVSFPNRVWRHNDSTLYSDLDSLNAALYQSFIGSRLPFVLNNLSSHHADNIGYLIDGFENLGNFYLPSVLESTPFLSQGDVSVRGSAYVLAYQLVGSELTAKTYAFACELTASSSGGNVIVSLHLPENFIISVHDQIDGTFGLFVFKFGTSTSEPWFAQTSNSFVPPSFLQQAVTGDVVDATSDFVINSNPFVGENPRVRLNALPFRGYEMICNYFYRFDKNNPYVLGGEAQYNEFIPTHGDGPDDNLYDFHYRNWELDRFTSALQSPQFGMAPLVGLIWTGENTVETTFVADDSHQYKVTLGVDADDNVDSILDFSGDVPSADLQRLQRRIQAGFSINDLRITNSFQRFLENVLRRGLRYRNQLKSHFGTDVDYPDIDVPQYIGGSSSYLDSGQVTNMSQGDAVLGDYNGTLQGGTATGNKIRCYCPEHGFIIGIVSITPIPSYAQSISKHMIKRDAFDYFLPEFGKIGFVPVHYSEVSPLQNLSSEGQDLSDVFGYQKAWYDYMESLDEVHGDFRTTLRDFVLSRTFKERPELGSAFTVGDPDQLNDIFVTTKIADKYGSSAKFLCSARFHVNALRPIPMVGTPSLE